MREKRRDMLLAKLRPYLAGLAVLVSVYVLTRILLSRQPGILWRVGLGIIALLVMVDNLWLMLGKEPWRPRRLISAIRRKRRS